MKHYYNTLGTLIFQIYCKSSLKLIAAQYPLVTTTAWLLTFFSPVFPSFCYISAQIAVN